MDGKVDVLQKKDKTYLSWSRSRHSSGTAGSFLKAQEEYAGKKFYYKLSDFDSVKGIVGHEAVNEIVADRLLTILGIDHVEYSLIKADVRVYGKECEAFVCSSENFRKPGEGKIALDALYSFEKTENETPWDFCIRFGWEKYISEMLIADFLILNRDRHGANIEILRDSDGRLRPAPLFDHGLSLLFSCKNDEAQIEKYDVFEDKPVQCFVGSNSSSENLELIRKKYRKLSKQLRKEDLKLLTEDLDKVISKKHCRKIEEMIWKRWEQYEDFCNKK